MAIHRKLEEFRVQIRKEQKQQHFAEVRCSLLKDLKQLEKVESASEDEVIRWINQNAANRGLDFTLVRSYLNYNVGRLSPCFVEEFTRCVLDNFQHSSDALIALSILLERCQFVWPQSGTKLYSLVSEGRESELLEAGVLTIYKLFQSSQRKETFIWLAQQYSTLVTRLGCNELLMLMLIQLSQYEELVPSQQVLLQLMSVSRKECSPLAFVRICALAQTFHEGSKAFRFEVMQWAVDSLTEHECIKASLKLLSKYSFELEREQMQTLLRSGLIAQLISLSRNVPNDQRILLLHCLFDFLNSLQDELFQSIIPNYSLYQTLAASLSLELCNSDKFSLLTSLSLIFAIDPNSIAYFSHLNLLPYLFQLSNSSFLQLRTISCMMIEEYGFDY